MASTAQLIFDIFAKDNNTEGVFKGVAGHAQNVSKAVAGLGSVAAGFGVVEAGKKAVETFENVAGAAVKMQRYLGGSVEDASRVNFALSQVGLSGDDVTASLGKFSKNLEGATGNAKATAKMASELGFTFTDAHGKLLPMADILPKLSDKFKTMENGPEKTALAMNLFGKSGMDMVPFLNMGGAAMDGLMKKSDEMGATISQSQVAAFKDSKKEAREFNAAIQGLQITVGSALLPVIDSMTRFIREQLIPVLKGAADWFHSLDPGVRSIVLGFVAFLAVGGPLLLIVGKFAGAIREIQGVVGAFTNVFGVLNTVMKANPILFIVSLVALLVAGVIWAYNNVGWFKDGVDAAFKFIGDVIKNVVDWVVNTAVPWFIGAWNNVASFFSTLGDFFASVWNVIVDGVQWLVNGFELGFQMIVSFLQPTFDFFGAVFGAIGQVVALFARLFVAEMQVIAYIIKNFVMPVLAALGSFFATVWNWIVGVVSAAINGVSNAIRTIWGAVSSWFMGGLLAVGNFVLGVWNAIVGYVSGPLSLIWGAVTSVWNNVMGFINGVLGAIGGFIVSAFNSYVNWAGSILSGVYGAVTGAWNTVASWAAGIGGQVIGWFAGAGQWLWNAGANLVQGLMNGIGSLASGIGNWFLGLIPGWIVDPFKAALGIHSPSTVFHGFGQNIGQGLINGIASMHGNLGQAMGKLSSVMTDGFGGPDLSLMSSSSFTAAAPQVHVYVGNEQLDARMYRVAGTAIDGADWRAGQRGAR